MSLPIQMAVIIHFGFKIVAHQKLKPHLHVKKDKDMKLPLMHNLSVTSLKNLPQLLPILVLVMSATRSRLLLTQLAKVRSLTTRLVQEKLLSSIRKRVVVLSV